MRSGSFPAQEQTLLILIQSGEGFLVGEFLAAGLNREVGLAGGNDRLARVAVLNDQVAGITGEGDVIDFALSSFARFDQFDNIVKLIR